MMRLVSRKCEEKEKRKRLLELRKILGDRIYYAELKSARKKVVDEYRAGVAPLSSKLAEPKLAEPGHRYTAAWGEISQRIAQRQTLVAYYTTIGGAILSFSYLAKAGESDRTVLAYAIGPLSLMFSVLLGMHERQIAVLRSYLARIEKLDDTTLCLDLKYPKFHSPGLNCSLKAQDIRMYHDWVALALVGFYGFVAGCLVFFSHLGGDLRAMDVPDYIFSPIALLLWLLSLVWLHRNSTARTEIFDELVKCD